MDIYTVPITHVHIDDYGENYSHLARHIAIYGLTKDKYEQRTHGRRDRARFISVWLHNEAIRVSAWHSERQRYGNAQIAQFLLTDSGVLIELRASD